MLILNKHFPLGILEELGSGLWYLNTGHLPVFKENFRNSSIDREGIKFSWCCQPPQTVQQKKGLNQGLHSEPVTSGAGIGIKRFIYLPGEGTF